MLSTTLYSPLFPQMENDGVINLEELSSSGIVIDIAEYENARKGDLIELWFESYTIGSIGLAADPVSQYFPWQCSIAPNIADAISDGIYQVQYNVIDAAQNSAWSETGNAIIDRTSTGTLPPPLFPEAGADNTLTYDDAMSDGGTPVTVPNYSGISAGDNVTVFWVGLKDGIVVQRSITKVSHTVQDDELDGFNVFIATAFIIPDSLDTAVAWYVVNHSDSRNERSVNGSVNIDTSSGTMLPAPAFIEGNDGWIDAEEAASDNGTPVAIPAYPGIAVGDTVTTHWQGFTQEGIPVAEAKYDALTHVIESDLTDGFDVDIPTAFITPVEIGYGICYYDVAFASGSAGSSLAAEVGVDVVHSALPAPQLPEALDDGVIDNDDAMSSGGTPVVIAYDAMAEGDSVTLSWSGYQGANITPVSGSVYVTTRAVTAAESASGTLTFIVPSNYIMPIGQGYAVASYSVQFTAGGIAWSDDATATINTQGSESNGSSYLGGSTGYAPWNNTVIQGCYVEYLAMNNGSPLRNTDVQFTLYGNNYFTSNQLNTITLTTDLQGYVRTNISGADTTANTITAEIPHSDHPVSTLSLETERTNMQAVPYLTSDPYLPGSGNRKFLLSLSQNSGVFRLTTTNNADIYINGENKGGIVDNVAVSSGSPLEFEVTSNNLSNTAVTVSDNGSDSRPYCTYYF